MMKGLRRPGWEIVFLTILLGGGGLLWGQNSFSRGEDLFLRNKPGEALPFLEAAVVEDPVHIQAFYYLGMAYQQLDRLEDAITAYQDILPRAGDETSRVAYNLGNLWYAKGDADTARQYYTLSIEADPAHASAYLNRANAEVRARALREAITDYEVYLSLEPRSPKRPRIEQLLAFIREEFAGEERRRLVAEQQSRIEAERKRRLLEEVSASLHSAAEDIQGVSAGSEDVQGYEGEFELE
jgi:tetratricopeptide (TPR) repeat protein